jgi:hypothetical protein
VLQQCGVLQPFDGLEVEEVGCGQFIQFVGDALHHQRRNVAIQGDVDVGVGARAALGA